MTNKFLIQFDPNTGERLNTVLYDDDISQEQADSMLADGYEIVSEKDWNKLIGNYDGYEYIRDPQTKEYVRKPAYEPTFQELKNQKLEAISTWTEKRITGGFKYNSVTYDSDVDTQITMQGIALNVNTPLFSEKYPEGCPVRGYDDGSSVKTIHMLSAEEVLGFCAALSMHIGESKQLGWLLQQRVAEARTKEELAAVTWAE